MAGRAQGSIVRRLLAGGVRQGGAFMAGLVVYPVVARVLDSEGLGAWALLGAASFLLGLSDLGLSTVVQRKTVAKDLAGARSAMSQALLALAVLQPLVGLLFFFFLLEMPAEVSPAMRADAANASIVVLVAGALLGFTQPYRIYVFARGRDKEVAIARTLASLLQVAIVCAGFYVAQTLLVPAGALLARYAFAMVYTVVAARRLDTAVPLWPALPRDGKELVRNLRDGAAAATINIAAAIALRVDLFVISRVVPLATVAAYAVAGRAVDIAYKLVKQGTVVIMPDLGDADQRAEALRVGTVVFAGVIISGMAALALNGQPLLVLWVGEAAAGHTAWIVLVLLSLGTMVMGTYEVASSMVLMGSRTAWGCAVPIMIGSGLNLTISLVGALVLGLGIWAVAGSTIVGHSVSMLLMWRAARRIVGWSGLEAIRAIAPVAAATVAALCCGLALAPVAVGHWAASLGCCVATMGAGVATAAVVTRLQGRHAAS